MNTLQTMRAEGAAGLLALLSGLAGLAGRQRSVVRRHRPIATATVPTTLARAATLWVSHPRGRVVACEAGTLWLTFDGEAHDIVLDAGESHRCDSDARLAIHALATARLQLFPRPAPARR